MEELVKSHCRFRFGPRTGKRIEQSSMPDGISIDPELSIEESTLVVNETSAIVEVHETGGTDERRTARRLMKK